MRFTISKNIGRVDQLIRLSISLSMIYFGFINLGLIDDEFSATLIGIFGSLNLIVALVQFCPLYAAVGINTYCQSSSKN
ncbi:MAG: DUF2892 domain-containing protein [Gammaproteobacteria bacterium]|nr:DUF2892 domain-containing protein [Gammaproteobacteria bacterium]